jgi:hypothetical protein
VTVLIRYVERENLSRSFSLRAQGGSKIYFSVFGRHWIISRLLGLKVNRAPDERASPELRREFPPTAIGKDFLPGGAVSGVSPSGTGLQLSVFGLAGLLAGWEDGIELNLLGLIFGIDVRHPALKLPAVGRLRLTPPLAIP